MERGDLQGGRDFCHDVSTRLFAPHSVGLSQLLIEIVARRGDSPSTSSNESCSQPKGGMANMPLEDVVEVIELPNFDRRAFRRQRENSEVTLPSEVILQLKSYISEVASM